MNALVAADQTTWWGQFVSSASSILGIGETTAALSTLARKRNLSTLWEMDPVAAPPKAVQTMLVGTPAAEDMPQTNEEDTDTEGPQELRSVLEVQLKFAMRRHDVERVRLISRQLRRVEDSVKEEEEAHACDRAELCVGDKCFALAKVVEWEWYSARLLHVRSRHPQLQVEYLATLDGDVSTLALPVPRINNIPIEHVCIQTPVIRNEPIQPPTVPCVTTIGQ